LSETLQPLEDYWPFNRLLRLLSSKYQIIVLQQKKKTVEKELIVFSS
jgi:hypothetical protein